MGYTATWAGLAASFVGMSAMVIAPIVGRVVGKLDVRLMISSGVLWIGAVTLWRAHWTTDADFWTVALPQLVQGFGIPLFMLPLPTQIGRASWRGKVGQYGVV